MYAVIKTGGKQYRVSEGDVLRVEKLDAEDGASIMFDEVLMLSDGENIRVGAPVLDGASVAAEVVGSGKGDKVTIIKFKRRHNYKRTKGHRQPYTDVKITGITAG